MFLCEQPPSYIQIPAPLHTSLADTAIVMAQSNGYPHDSWAMPSYDHSPYDNSPMNEYANWSGYVPPHGMLPSAPQQHEAQQQTQSQQTQQDQQHQHQTSHQHQTPQLPMLNTTWPSQLTNPTPPPPPPQPNYSAPPPPSLSSASTNPLPPVPKTKPVAPAPTPNTSQAPSQVPSRTSSLTPTSSKAPTKSKAGDVAKTMVLPRKTLSAEQKRAMCQYSEENPGTRQMDIGRKFGVERSTVSKVLRHKEQHLKRGGYDNSTGSKKKGKAPDVELTLANYVRRRLARGVEVTDELIIENGKLFAKTGENQHKYTDDYFSPAWLQHFKSLYMHPNGSMGRLMRRASDTSIPDRMHMSTPRIRQRRRSGGAAAAEAIVSPLSPHAGHMSPLSEADGVKEEAVAPEGLGLDFTYQTTASHSATSLTNDVSFSPTGAFTFSPDPNSGGPFSMGQQHMPFGAAAPHPDMMHHQRDKRSNTYPSLNMEAVNGLGGDPATPRHLSSASTLDSHSPLYAQRPFSIDTSASTLTSPPALHRSGSNSSLTGRTPVDVSPVSPSHEDARRAASTLLSYIQHMSAHGQFEHNEYLILVQLTKKLQVHQLQHQPSRSMSVGGLSRIPEGDGEMMMNPHSCAMAPTEPQG